MSSRSPRAFERRYAVTLRKFLTNEQEALLEQAYELGRVAIARGSGVLDMARVHQQAIQAMLRPAFAAHNRGRALRAAETFFLESLSPFEATHRGFQETNLKLQQLIATLEKRNVDLAASNCALATEIEQRKRTEKALRRSEDHFRELFNEARRMEENLRSLSNQILHAQEEERKRISRELHDEVGQALTAVSVTLATLKNDRGGSPFPTVGQKLADAQQLLQESMEAVHGFARELRPTILDELGLVPALRSCLQAFAERTGLTVRLRANPMAEQLNSEQKTVLFRVAQESLTNVAKHAEASRVDVLIRKAGDGIRMDVADNGKSFRQGPTERAKGKRRLGLLGMQERVRLVSGTFTVKPDPGRGTTIRVVIPFKSPSALLLSKQMRDGGHKHFSLNGRRRHKASL